MAARPSAVLAQLPAGPGVYRFRDAGNRVCYLGRAVNLRRRVASYWGDLRERTHLRRMVDATVRIEALQCDSEPETAWLERTLLAARMPPANRTVGGAEVPVYIRLDDRPDPPVLTVEHDPLGPGLIFGPYLGGARVRLAVSGIRRVWPVHYAGRRLTGATRAMAEIRGVAPSDGVELAVAVTATLRRKRAYVARVSDELLRRREHAARGLAFELAGRIDAEIAAVQWIAADCKTASLRPTAHPVAAWRDGVLVRLTVEDGFVIDWQVRACSERAAADDVVRTPRRWAEFAARNAELAARLRAAESR